MTRKSVSTPLSVLALAASTLFAGAAFAQSGSNSNPSIIGTDPVPQIIGTDPTPQIIGTDPVPQIIGTDPTPQMVSSLLISIVSFPNLA
jgi:hypothetical protein